MPKTNIPTLGAVAQAQAEDKKKGKLAQALAILSGALGLANDAKPAAGMTKKTVTTKRVEMEESDDEEETGAEGGSDAEEAEEATSTTSTSDESSEASAEDDEEPKGESEDDEAKYEEEEEKALARAVSKALNSAAVHQAFLAALPEKFRDVGALYSPHRLASAAKKATSQKSTFAAMGSLASFSQKLKASTEKVLSKQAKLEKRVVQIEGARRQDRVNAIVAVAKERGVPGATSKEGRQLLREYGMQHGTKQLTAFIASQGPGLRTVEALPRADGRGNAIGAPTTAEQEKLMEQAMSGLNAKEREQFKAILAEKQASQNAAGRKDF